MNKRSLPSFPYGAVYFRKSNPPKQDWERDYKTASEDGMNIFRHWFLWSAIEIAPGRFDWDDYDRQLDLAAQNGIKTIIAEMITAAPEWTFRRFAHARFETRDGRKIGSHISGSCVTGGFPGLCLDNDDYKELAEHFLIGLVSRYKDHPGLCGYDIWNECNYSHDTCYCPATAAKFQDWLKNKYGDLKILGETWYRHSFAQWEDITPPRYLGAYPDVLDWLQFKIDNAYQLMRWRAEIIRTLDKDHAITAHGIVGGLDNMASGGSDDWRAASEVDVYGFTWVSCRKGDESWKQFHAVDLVRASSHGKEFWHTEAQGGHLWMQPQVINKPRDEGRIASPEDLCYWNLISFMCGATGLFYVRWRPLLDGPLFGAFGPYGLDGSRTPRSEMGSRLAKWTNAPEQQNLWQSRPIKGEVGIIYVPETQIFTYAQQENTGYYAQSIEGAYQGLFDNNIQADWVHINHIDEYDLLYLPFPVMLNQETADKLKVWVEKGGTLICEGCPAYFGDRGRAGTVQPNLGLNELFGVRESYVEFTPDILGGLKLTVNGTRVWGGLFLQIYEPTTGNVVGYYEDGRVAAVDNIFGKGKTRLIGTMIGAGYHSHPKDRDTKFFADLLDFAGKQQYVKCSDSRVKARLHDGAGGTYLWVANPDRNPIPVELRLGDMWEPFSSCYSLWGSKTEVNGNIITMTAEARNVTVIELKNG